MKKELRKLSRELMSQGFTVRQTAKGHLAVYLEGLTVAVFAGTASDRRSHKNGLARLRRAGFITSMSI